MSKKINENIVKKIINKELVIRPKWIFWIGSIFSILGLIVSTSFALLSIQLLRFRLTHPGIGAARKVNFILTTLPWYIPFFAVISLVAGYFIIKRYDFSYRKNLTLIGVIILIALYLSTHLLDFLGLNTFMSKRGYFGRVYGQQQENSQMNRRMGR